MTVEIFRKKRGDHQQNYVCDGCGSIDAPAIALLSVSPFPRTSERQSRVCKACLLKAYAMFDDPGLVETRTPMRPDEAKARGYATKLHEGQKYDSGTAPYVVHLAEVRDVCVEFGWDETAYRVAAWLHDTIEDTDTTADMIETDFGERVRKLVWAVTGEGKNRRERNEDAYKKMISYPDAIPLKLADRIANARASKETSPDALFEMYAREHPAFKDRLKNACGFDSKTGGTFDPRTNAMWRALDEIFGVGT